MKWSAVIPTPLSVNRLYRSVNGRSILSREGREWKREAASFLVGAPQLGDGPFRVEVALPKKIRGDVDNRLKAAIDLLQDAGVISNDRYVHDLRVYRGDGAETIVTVEVIE